MKSVQMTLSVMMPGFGHVLSGRVTKGVILWALFSALVVGSFARAVVLGYSASADWLFTCVVIGGAAVWAYAVVDTIKFTYGLGRRPDPEQLDALCRAGMTHYIRDELDEAADWFRQAERLSRRDPCVQLSLATVHELQGNRRAARCALRRCARFDEQGAWTDDIDELWAKLKLGPQQRCAPAEGALTPDAP